MSTPFLLSFTESVLVTLHQSGDVELEDGQRDRVVEFVAARLANANHGESLVSTLAAALLACPWVEEIYVDDDQLKDVITDLPRAVIPRGKP